MSMTSYLSVYKVDEPFLHESSCIFSAATLRSNEVLAYSLGRVDLLIWLMVLTSR